MAANKPLGFQRLVFRLVLDPAKRLGRRHVVGRLVDPAEQHRDVFEFHAGAPFDGRKGEFRQVSISGCRNRTGIQLSGDMPPASPWEVRVIGVGR